MREFFVSLYAFFFDKVLRKHLAMKKYLRRNYADIIQEFRRRPAVSAAAKPDYPLWFCWWQGAEKMPEMVKACYQALRQNANGHAVKLITKNNYQNFVKIPPFLTDKLAQGLISLTHFSDILRMYLLYEHGGLWLDATILTTAPLPSFAGLDIFTIRRRRKDLHVGRGRWTAYLFYMTKGNLLADFMKTIFTEYWQRETKMLDYFLVDYCIAAARDNIPAIRQMLDAVPYSNENIYALKHKLGAAYDARIFAEICRTNYLHKLTWKEKFPRRRDGKLTFYGKIVSTA
ncbi:mannosyltransferase OCH1 [Candidatus Termititenax aidoneus]|uniref:Mannosyltransferase OCH1 n=1 Tax=Termititenax aidoneus TaxID=2218524 RepID=A0A388TCV0_TERA1|nr:mannosyltransferase OCH1 [Candidatus Termititenax aidoneus]